MSAPSMPTAALSPTALEQRLLADQRQLSRQQMQAPPPTIDLGVTLDELAVEADQAELRQAQMNLSGAPVAKVAELASTPAVAHIDVVA